LDFWPLAFGRWSMPFVFASASTFALFGDVKLFTQMEEEAGRLAGETACRSKDKVGGNQEIGDVGGVDFASDSGVFAGRAFVLSTVLPSGASQTRRKAAVSRCEVVVPR
jgi:hypothetical protein